MFYFLTFPGVIIHEWAHKIFCQLSGLKVVKVVYFKFGNPSGYVIHEAPQNYLQSFLVATGPIIFNSLIAYLLSYGISYLTPGSYWRFILLWLAFSIAFHAFPSDKDLSGAASDGLLALKRGTSLWPLIGFPLLGLMWLAGHFGIVFKIAFALLLLLFGVARSGLLVL